jgi:hypothetical protein
MSSAWAGGTDAIIERMDKMTTLFIEEARKSIYSHLIKKWSTFNIGETANFKGEV